MYTRLRISVLETLCSEESRFLSGCDWDPGHCAARPPDHHWCCDQTDDVNGSYAADTMNCQLLQAFLWYHLDWPTEVNMSQHLTAGGFFIKTQSSGLHYCISPPQSLLEFPHRAQSGSPLQMSCVLIPSTQSLPCPTDPFTLLHLVAQSFSVWLFATPGTAARQPPLSMEILQARKLECVAMPSSRGSSQPRDWTQISYIADGFFTDWATREAPLHIKSCYYHACIVDFPQEEKKKLLHIWVTIKSGKMEDKWSETFLLTDPRPPNLHSSRQRLDIHVCSLTCPRCCWQLSWYITHSVHGF